MCSKSALLCFALTLALVSCASNKSRPWNRDVLFQAADGDVAAHEASPGADPVTVTVVPLQCGTLDATLSGALNLDHPSCEGIADADITAPLYAFLVIHPRLGPLLIDTGCSSDYLDNPYGHMKGFLLLRVMNRVNVQRDETIESRLAQNGLKPSDIRCLLLTHLHFDHTSGLSAFPEGIPMIAGNGEKSITIPGFVEPRHFRKGDMLSMLDFTSPYAVDTPLGTSIDIVGDGSILAISTPGHTAGHVSWLVNTDSGPILIAGDAVVLRKSLELRVGTGSYAASRKGAQKTLERIVDNRAAYPGLRIWPGHDIQE